MLPAAHYVCMLWVAMSQGDCCSSKDESHTLKSLHALLSNLHRTSAGTHSMVPTLVAVPGKSRQRFVLLPPPPDRTDLLSIVDLGKAAEVVHC